MSTRFLVPEVVQTSEMDCGPASLKALLEGHDIPVSYGRLREACQTHVDGTSIDTIEEVAVQLGLDAEQMMLPVDHLTLPEAKALPALVVTLAPSGMTHFVILWRVHGPLVQVMDPAQGRRWLTAKRFAEELFVHSFPVPAAAWREWAGSEEFLAPLRARLKRLGIGDDTLAALVQPALADPGWQGLATLDAATRLVAPLVNADGVPPGEPAAALLKRLVSHPEAQSMVPDRFWFVRPALPAPDAEPAALPERLLMRGAVLVRVSGLRAAQSGSAEQAAPAALPPELVTALHEAPANPLQAIWQTLRADGGGNLAALAIALLLSAAGVTVEAVLLQWATRLAQAAPQPAWSVLMLGVLLTLVINLFALQAPIAAVTWRLARRLDARVRLTILEKIPRLSDRYFHSRLVSDMVKRVHDLRMLRLLPSLATRFLYTSFQLLLTTAGLIYLSPGDAPLILLFLACVVGVSYLASQLLQELEMRLRTYVGALSRIYLDAMLGLMPLRTHGAERVMRHEQEGLLSAWAQSSLQFGRLAVALQIISGVLFNAFAVLLVFRFLNRSGQGSNTALLQFYWSMNLVALGQSLVDQARQYPTLRNLMLRVLEVLGAPDEAADGMSPPEMETGALQTGAGVLAGAEANPSVQQSLDSIQQSMDSIQQSMDSISTPGMRLEPVQGVAIQFENVGVEAGGHTILSQINLTLRPGEHIAIVGPSGAGKSSLVGVLLGSHQPASGQCRVDGATLDGSRLPTLRRDTAWVDPAIQLWNRSLLQNLVYGNSQSEGDLSGVLEEADLFGVLERLPEGLQTELGEGGGLVSGGEGQRVRLGRALGRSQARLVILDEPFRGLDREKRRQLLKRARAYWQKATLICITHDVGETQGFDRAVVVEAGGIVEDDAPAALAARPDSRYNALLRSEEQVRVTLWQGAEWRRLWLEAGRLSETTNLTFS